MVAILHNIRSRHNVGSILRTADAAGIEKIYLCGITPAPTDRFGKVYSEVAKVALGAEKTVPWEKCFSAGRLIDRLKKDGYKILAAEQSGNSSRYFKFKIKNLKLKIAVVFGNEVRGLPRSILKKADKILEIPMHGEKESLNVAVAFGIIVFQLIIKE